MRGSGCGAWGVGRGAWRGGVAERSKRNQSKQLLTAELSKNFPKKWLGRLVLRVRRCSPLMDVNTPNHLLKRKAQAHKRPEQTFSLSFFLPFFFFFLFLTDNKGYFRGGVLVCPRGHRGLGEAEAWRRPWGSGGGALNPIRKKGRSRWKKVSW